MGKKAFYFLGSFFITCVLIGNIFINKNNETVIPAISYSIGSYGATVERIQNKLSQLGYFNGEADGIYGQVTYEAVRLFQQNNGLIADGIAGEATLNALGIEEVVNDAREVDVLAKAIFSEARGEPYEGQVAVGGVILNRVDNEDFPDSIIDVVYQPGAFDAVRDGQINLVPNEQAYNAAVDAINGYDPSEGSLYYWNPSTATSTWIWSVPISKQIGRHVFGSK